MPFSNYFDDSFNQSRGLINNHANGQNMSYYTPTPTANQMAQPRDFKQDYNWKEGGLYQTGGPGVHQYVAQNSNVAWDKLNTIARQSGTSSGSFGENGSAGASSATAGGGGSFLIPSDKPASPETGDTGLGGPADGTPAYLDRTAQMSYAQADAQTSIDNANKMAKARAAAQGLDYNPNAFDYAAQQSMVSSQANTAGVKTDIANVGFKNDFEKLKIQEGYQDRRMLAQLKEQEKQSQLQADIASQQNYLQQRKYNDSRKDLRAKGRAAKQLLNELEKRNTMQSNTASTVNPMANSTVNSTASSTPSSTVDSNTNRSSYVSPYDRWKKSKGTINGVNTGKYMFDHIKDYDVVGNGVLHY